MVGSRVRLIRCTEHLCVCVCTGQVYLSFSHISTSTAFVRNCTFYPGAVLENHILKGLFCSIHVMFLTIKAGYSLPSLLKCLLFHLLFDMLLVVSPCQLVRSILTMPALMHQNHASWNTQHECCWRIGHVKKKKPGATLWRKSALKLCFAEQRLMRCPSKEDEEQKEMVGLGCLGWNVVEK